MAPNKNCALGSVVDISVIFHLSSYLGELHVPLDVCGAVVKRELDFWGVDEYLIKPCCWTCYSSYIDNQRALADFNRSVKREMEELSSINHLTGWKKKQMRIWMLLDHPRSSKVALVSEGCMEDA